MKIGRRYKTTSFGTDAERYCARLYNMDPNPYNHRRPDLVSRGPHDVFSIEVKSGLRAGVLVQNQLSYGFQDEARCRSLFGDERTDALLHSTHGLQQFPNEGEQTYYLLIERTDNLPAKELTGDYAAIRLTWGDQHIFPAELALYYFAAHAAQLTGDKPSVVIKKLQGKIWRNLRDNSSHYKDMMYGDWANLPFSSMRALYAGDSSIVRHPIQRKTVETCLKLAQDHTPFDEYERRLFQGPNDTTVAMMYERNYNGTIDQLVRAGSSNSSTIEDLTQQRAQAVTRLGTRKLRRKNAEECCNGGIDAKRRRQLTRQGVHPDFLDDLERLVWWQSKE